jgi:hypothetical protein
MSVGRQDYGERKERKIDAYKARAIKSTAIANQQLDRAHTMGSAIPFGQPILVGHHSEGAHRALLKRIDNAHRKASEEYGKAGYYENKALSAETNHAISGDDPEAAERYRQKLAELEKAQEHMKAVNKAWRRDKAALIASGLSETESVKLVNERIKPCPAWMLSNNNAEIRRVKEKIETLKKLDGMKAENVKFSGGEIVINLEINRVQFIFDDIPAPEKRKLLKSHGFKWSPSEKAWQRQRTLNAIKAAKWLIQEYFTS